ncbi:MAG: hypothetical protein LBJ00_11285 [Planctomycetaceae bacterium]|jgi:hypothetical protein|nr:hypothetical protein [Planctomycetaceae bacterium]
MRIFITVVVWISLLCLAALSAEETHLPMFSIRSYPKTLMIGDTLYAVFSVNNPHEESIEFNDIYLGSGRFWGTVHLDIIDSAQKVIPLLIEVPDRMILTWVAEAVRLEPKETRIVGLYSVTIPPLEDLYGTPYWQKLLDNLPKEGVSFKLRVTASLYPHNLRLAKEENKFFLEEKFLIQQRPKKDLDRFKQWYENTPKNLMPEIDTRIAPLPVKVGKAYMKEVMSKLPKGYYHIFNLNYRYPGYPNLPKDWQAWKKLEESFEPGTLRDEIRWKRICVQYYTTADDKVLNELKAWLEKMNPIQRSVMVNYSHKAEDLPNSEKLYETIQLFKDKK